MLKCVGCGECLPPVSEQNACAWSLRVKTRRRFIAHAATLVGCLGFGVLSHWLLPKESLEPVFVVLAFVIGCGPAVGAVVDRLLPDTKSL